MMILTVTLNPLLNKTYLIPHFVPGSVHWAEHGIAAPGGSGINIARTLQHLSIPTRTTGILGGHIGRLIAAKLEKESIPQNFVWIEDQSCLSISIIDSEGQTHTHITEPSPIVPQKTYRELQAKLAELAPLCRWVVFSGVPPLRAPVDIFFLLIKTAAERGAKVFLATEGPWLEAGIKAKPDLLQLTWPQFLRLVGPCYSTVQAAKAARGLTRRGIKHVIVSTGGKGVLAVSGDKAYFSRSVSTAENSDSHRFGDVLTAGLLAELSQGRDFPTALHWGLAAAAASTTELDPIRFDLGLAEQYKAKITLNEIPY
ncbi:MAG: hypothetical protein GX101_04915 [Firmicutes bacterium]|jgi:tagatose 6-phosphate kinase|nr:PfkB family carbohydrate kinase [Bacillota bacterium]NLO66014.1 hypothetical protein [Bacillota bacterium]